MSTTIQLHFPQAPEIRTALSAIVPIGNTLWLANDEAIHLERLLPNPNDPSAYSVHQRFALHAHLQLPVAATAQDNEIDVEGLDYHDGFLWVVGSHSLKRSKPKADKANAIEKLATVKRDANRYLLARLAVEFDAQGLPYLAAPAAQLPLTSQSSVLMKALRADPHLAPFLAIPGKDNGFDIEGIAAVGSRVFVGLRGPVLRGWAVVLELEAQPDPKQPVWLQLAALGGKKQLYRKHFLPLEGLGIRDLCVQGDDLLLLAGPTMNLDGPVRVYRWHGGARVQAETVAQREAISVVAEIAHGQGVDHAEGMALWQQADGTTRLLIVYDNAAPARYCAESGVLADVIPL